MKHNPELLLVAGGTEITGTQTERVLSLPAEVASIARIHELRRVVRTEQFLELGACSTLTGLLSLVKGTLPDPLREVIGKIGTLGVRNIATLGGNLCSGRRFMDLWPFLACMDSQIELRSESGSRWASVSHLGGESGSPGMPARSLMTRVRIPIYNYNFMYHRKLGPSGLPGKENASFVCVASIDRNKIEQFKLVFAGEKSFRLKDVELSVAGRKTGITKREVHALIDIYCNAFSSHDWFDHRVFNSLVEESIERLFS